ncbi:MAG: hypothetical protein K1X89_21805 [Myxococcaceae bacterium]|nr:hypothetical protein [Myxococcaceae bacterium]
MPLALLAALVVLADPPLPTGVPAAPEGPNPFLVQAREDAQALDFERCVGRVRQAAQWKSNQKELVELEVLGGVCNYNLNRRVDAREHFRLALRMSPDAELPAYSSPKLVDFFLWVKKRLQGPPTPFPAEDLPPDAPLDGQLLPRDRGGADYVRPFEVRPLPVVFGSVAVAMLATGIGLGLSAKNLEAQAKAAMYEVDYGGYANAARGNALGANIAYGIAGAAVVGAVVSFLVGRPSAPEPMVDPESAKREPK